MVIIMDMIGKVRRMKLRDQLSDGEICRRTGLARNTVKKWLNAPGDIAPKYKRKKADGKLTPFETVLEQALRTDAHRAKHARRSGRVDLTRSHGHRWTLGFRPRLFRALR